MFTTTARDACLGLLDSKFLGLVKSISNWRAGTFVEADYTGYDATTRPGITFGAQADTSPAGGRQVANSAEVVCDQNTGASQDLIAYVIMSATTGGVAWGFGLLDSDTPILGTVTLASPGVVTAYAHGFVDNQRVFFMAAPGAVTPTGFAENTAYFVANAATNTFTLSGTTANGTPVNTSAAGAGQFIPYTAVTVANLATPKLAIGTIVVQL